MTRVFRAGGINHNPNHDRTDEKEAPIMTTSNSNFSKHWSAKAREDGDLVLADAIDRTAELGRAPREKSREWLVGALHKLSNYGAIVIDANARAKMDAAELRGVFKVASSSAGRNLEAMRADSAPLADRVAAEVARRDRVDERDQVRVAWDQQHLTTLGRTPIAVSRSSRSQRTDGGTQAERIADAIRARRADEDAKALKHDWDNQHLETLRAGEAAHAALHASPSSESEP